MKATKLSIMGVAISLFIIGIVSNTPIRHTIQLTPLIIVLLLAKKSWSRYAALAVLLFWFFIMSLIWLYLSGLSDTASGTYSAIEIILTLTIGVSCIIGIISSFNMSTSSKKLLNIMAFVAFLILQIAMMWISFQGYIANS
jgi:hypothetical protein